MFLDTDRSHWWRMEIKA